MFEGGNKIASYACIYKIENTANGKKYIGQTQNYKKRITAHRNQLNRGIHSNQKLQRAWNKYGEDKFIFEVVEKCEIENLDSQEIYWIKYYDSISTGYNIQSGGKALRGYKLSFDARQKMKDNHADFSGTKNPMYQKKLSDMLSFRELELRKSRISMSVSEEKNPFYKKSHKEETKQLISSKLKAYYKRHDNPMLGRHHTKTTIEKMRLHVHKSIGKDNFKARQVVCLNTSEIYETIASAAQRYNINYSGISTCCSHKTHYAGKLNGEKLVWMYYDDFVNADGVDIIAAIQIANRGKSGANNANAKSVLCLDNNKIFGSAAEAARYYHCDNSQICKCCNGKSNYAGKDPISGEKLHWKYI